VNDLGLDVEQLVPWFRRDQDEPFVRVHVPENCAAAWADELGVPVRRCYLTDAVLEEQAERTGNTKSAILAAKLPDRGSVMAGDFGEILVFLYHAAQEHPAAVIGPKKWRLKQDRTKPAPYSDVVHFLVPTWPDPSDSDCLVCSEVKTKSTAGSSTPVASAIADSEKDRTSRLAKTLVWLRERALTEELGTVSIDHLERFIDATDHPPAEKRFHAVAVVCESLVDDEVAEAPETMPTDYAVIVIAVPDLKRRYEGVFDAVHATVAAPEGGT
jgi:hypothetical protein